MKYAVALATILAAVAVVCDASVIQATPRSNLSVGYVATGDTILYRTYVYRAAIPNGNQYGNVVWRGNANTTISKVEASEVGDHQADAWITEGGIGRSNVSIKFQSWRGYGYNYLLEIWGR